jgi:cobyrinic acid a,c-diamide synthase
MPVISTPRLLIAGTSSGVGKSLLTTGLTVALRKRGISVSCCTSSKDLHQSVLYQRMSRRHVRTLDQRLLDPEMIRFSLYQAGLGADVVLIDGHAGLYDGWGLHHDDGADVELAKITQTPIVLLAHFEEFTTSAAALVYGYSHFRGTAPIRAVIANQFNSDESNFILAAKDSLSNSLGNNGLPSCFGVVPTIGLSSELPPRSFSQQTNVTSLPSQFFHDLAELVATHVDIDGLMALARTAPEIELPIETPPPQNRRCRIAVADDGCFSVAFQDNVDLFRYFGAEIVSFSPIADSELPERVSGLYLGGAYLQAYGVELSLNSAMHGAIRDFVEQGGLLFSEGAGTAYLCKRFQIALDEELQEGVGVMPFDAMLAKTGQREVEIKLIEDSILGQPGEVLSGVDTGEFLVKGDGSLGRQGMCKDGGS